jgi:hypothetical protein
MNIKLGKAIFSMELDKSISPLRGRCKQWQPLCQSEGQASMWWVRPFPKNSLNFYHKLLSCWLAIKLSYHLWLWYTICLMNLEVISFSCYLLVMKERLFTGISCNQSEDKVQTTTISCQISFKSHINVYWLTTRYNCYSYPEERQKWKGNFLPPQMSYEFILNMHINSNHFCSFHQQSWLQENSTIGP